MNNIDVTKSELAPSAGTRGGIGRGEELHEFDDESIVQLHIAELGGVGIGHGQL